jgi:hypothetical protein
VSILVHLVSKLPQQNKCNNKTLPLVVQVDDNAYHNAHNNLYFAPFFHTLHFAKATKIHTMILTVLIPSKNLNLLYNDNKDIQKVTLSFASYPLFQQYPPSKEILWSLSDYEMLKLSISCTGFQSNYSSCTGKSSKNICSISCSGKRKERMKPPKLMEKLDWIPVISFCKISFPIIPKLAVLAPLLAGFTDNFNSLDSSSHFNFQMRWFQGSDSNPNFNFFWTSNPIASKPNL